MQDRVERAGAQSVPMPSELVDHRLAEDRTFSGVVEDMKADQACIKLPIIHRDSISRFDIESRV